MTAVWALGEMKSLLLWVLQGDRNWHFLAKLSFPSKISNGTLLFLIWNKTKPWCLHLLVEDHSPFWAASGLAQIRGEMVSVKCTLHSHFHSQPWPCWKSCSSSVGSGLNLFILCPTLFSQEPSGKVCKGIFFKNCHCCKGCCVIFSFHTHKTHSQVWAYVQWPPTIPSVFVGLWFQEISPFPHKRICVIFVLTWTSEVKMSVLSLPLQTGNYLLWCGPW